MPSTCQNANKRAKIEKGKTNSKAVSEALDDMQFYQLIPRMQFSVNMRHLQDYCAQSIRNICALYDIPTSNSVIEKLHSIIHEPKTSHNMLLALFYLLFNLDTTMKNNMMQAEPVATQKKITHFAMHIRDVVIPDYMNTESQRVMALVDNCSDAWSNA
tara:strand:- start:164 stop:637 length:474 start_codon:yes stop_codon:yes gene_type:complete